MPKFRVGQSVWSKNNLNEELRIESVSETSDGDEQIYRAGRNGMICIYLESELTVKRFGVGDIVRNTYLFNNTQSPYNNQSEFVVEKVYGDEEPYYKMKNCGLLMWDYQLQLVKRFQKPKKQMAAKKPLNRVPLNLHLFFPDTGVMFAVTKSDMARLIEPDNLVVFWQYNTRTYNFEFVLAMPEKEYCFIGNVDTISGVLDYNTSTMKLEEVYFRGKNMTL